MDREFLQDLFSAFGPVSLRRMFSGYGVSVDGVNFALVLRGAIYFRTDEHNVARFEDEGVKPFQYAARGKLVTINSYWQLPDRLYDDPEELAEWARASLGAAERAAAVKRSRAARNAAKGTARGPAKSAVTATGRAGTGAEAKPSGRPAKAPAASRPARPPRAGKAASAGKTALVGKDKGKGKGKGKISAATKTPVRPKATRKGGVRTAPAKATKPGSGLPARKSPSGPTRR